MCSHTWFANPDKQVTAGIPQPASQVMQCLQYEAGTIWASLVKAIGTLHNNETNTDGYLCIAQAEQHTGLWLCTALVFCSCACACSSSSSDCTAQQPHRDGLLQEHNLVALPTAHLAVLPGVKDVDGQERGGTAAGCCEGLMVVQPQVIPEPHNGWLTATRHARAASTVAINALRQL